MLTSRLWTSVSVEFRVMWMISRAFNFQAQLNLRDQVKETILSSFISQYLWDLAWEKWHYYFNNHVDVTFAMNYEEDSRAMTEVTELMTGYYSSLKCWVFQFTEPNRGLFNLQRTLRRTLRLTGYALQQYSVQ